MDIIFIEDLTVDTVIGAYDWERTIKQRLLLNIQMASTIGKAAETDDLQYALDYNAVSKRVTEYIETSQHQLLETVAEQVCQLIQTEFKVPWLKVKVAKPGAVTNAKSVGIVVERGSLPHD